MGWTSGKTGPQSFEYQDVAGYPDGAGFLDEGTNDRGLSDPASDLIELEPFELFLHGDSRDA